MWNTLSSPPENFRFYKFTDMSHDKEGQTHEVNFDENRANLFNHDGEGSVPSESLVQTCPNVSLDNTNKPLSSLKSTKQISSTLKQDNAGINSKTHHKNPVSSAESKSQLQTKSRQKSSLLLSQNQQSLIKEQASKFSSSSKNNPNSIRPVHEFYHKNVDNEEDESFSQILIKQINNTEQSRAVLDSNQINFFREMVLTLREIRDISKESLITKKKLVKLLQDKNQISFLYNRDEKEEGKFFKPKKQPSKSFKRNPEKSTIKKIGKSVVLQQRLSKMQQKVKVLCKKIEDESMTKKVATLHCTKKKSMSILK